MTKIMNKKVLIVVVAAVLVCVCMAGTTLAWLVAETDPVTNTFTVGNINITLTESEGSNVDVNQYEFKMIPGSTIDKDPTVTVEAGSEACWLFVKIEEANNTFTIDSIVHQYITYEAAAGWIALGGVPGVYYREVNATTAAGGVTYSVLADDEVTVNSAITKAQMDALTATNLPTLSFTAYAVQSANVTTAADAWDIANP